MAEKDSCMTPEKSKMHFGKMKKKDDKIDPKIITHQLTVISKDIISNDIKKYLNDNISHEIYACFEETYAKKISEIIQSKGNFIQILDNWKDQNVNKFSSILEEVCGHLVSKEESKKFLLDAVVPYIMSVETNVESRDLMITVAFILLRTVQITDLTPAEYQQFLQAVNNKYFASIGQFRDASYHNWYKLWIFLVRFFGKKIHSSMDLTNKLLRIVEFAFRNSDYAQRIKGYDCWKELIDNASLDMKYISTSKQIKLLITPLKAKFSKQEIVICKRFDVFTYLLEKLGTRLVLCLPEYLEFCFGPLGDNKDNAKSGQCKNIPLLCEKSTKVLMELIGHTHGKGGCLQTNDVIKLDEPAINQQNFETYYKLIIQSVAESCVLLKDVRLGPQKDQAISCMWKSLFNLIIPASESNKPVYYKFLSGILENYIKEVSINTYFDDLLVNIVTTLLSFDKDFIYEAVQYFLAHILQVLLLTNLSVQEVDKLKGVLSHCFTKITFLEEKLCMLKDIMDCFMSSNTEINVNIGKIWICAADELVSDLDVPMIENFTQFDEFFIWPANHLHILDEQTNKQILLPWVKLYKKITSDQDSKKLIILKKLEHVFKNNPLLSVNILSILSVIAQFQTKYSKVFIVGLLEVTYSILQKPNLAQNEEFKACSIVLQYLDSTLECYTREKDSEIIELMCNCIQSIICVHKEYKLLESFSSFLKSIPEGIRTIFSEKLLQIITGLYNDVQENKSPTNKYLTKDLQKVLGAFECDPQKDDKKIFVAPAGRSARITQLAKKSPKSPKKQSKSPIALRLFGKDPETLSPLNVKGSQLNKSPNTKKKKAVNIIEVKKKISTPILEENSSDFVSINSEVKFDPNKLSEHQKEVLKRRRDDIPALYEDLSQSLSNSQDLFSAKFNINSIDSQKVEVLKADTPAVNQDECMNEIVENKTEFSGNVGFTTHKSEDLFSSNGICDNENAMDIEINGEKCLELDNEVMESPKEKNSKSGDMFDSSSSTEFNKITTDEKRKKKIQTELKKLKMDVVGADNYVSVPRRTRPKEKKENEEKETKTKGRKSMISNEKSLKDENTRRKSVGVVEELKLKSDVKTKDSVNVVSEEAKELAVVTNGKTKENVVTPKSKRTKETHEIKTADETNEIFKESEQIATKDDKSDTSGRKTKHNKDDTVKNDDTIKEAKIIQSKLAKETAKSTKMRTSDDKLDSPAVKSLNLTNGTVKKENIAEPKSPVKSTNRDIPSAETNKLDKSLVTSPIKSAKRNMPIVETPKTTRRPSLNALSSSKVVVDKKKPTEKADASDKDSEIDIKAKKGGKRKNKPLIESEDIIESSQESFADVTPMLNSSKKRKMSISEDTIPNKSTPKTVNIESVNIIKPSNIFKEDRIIEGENENDEKTPTEIMETEIEVVAVNTTQDTTVSRETTLDTTQTQDSLPDISLSSSKICKIGSADRQNTQDTLTQITQETPSQVGLDMLSEVDNPTVLYLDLPKKPQLTESEQMVCRMDTMSICANLEEFKSDRTSHLQSLEEVELQAGSPTKDDSEDRILESPSKNSIRSSPVTDNTPTKKTEFLNDTFDISPITSETNSYSSDENSSEIPVLKPIVFESKKFAEVIDPNKGELNVDGEKDDSICEESNQERFNTISKENQEIVNTNDEESDIRNNDVEDKNCVAKAVEEDVDNDKTTSDIYCETDTTNETRNTVVEVQKLSDLNSFSSDSEKESSTSNSKVIPDSAENHENIRETGDNGELEQISECLLPKSREQSSIQERSSRLLQMISRNSPVPNSSRFIKRRCVSAASPSTGRIKRLMYSLQAKPIVEKMEEEVDEDDILTFSREIPSPLAVPRNSILKRKFSDTNDSDSMSPAPKRKRVNFSDPCLTSRKVFIKEEYQQPPIEAKRLFDPNLDNNTGEDNLQHIFFDLLDNIVNTETEDIQTEPSMEIVNAHLLKQDKPIYPKLVHCPDDVALILKKITSPLFIHTLMNRLKSKRIRTIGDLAVLSETEINRLPFKVPVVANVYRTLDNYYKKKSARDEINDQHQQQVNNGVAEVENDVKVVNDINKEVAVKRLDFKGQIEELLKKCNNGNFNLEAISRMFFSSLEDSARLNILKQCNIPLKDVLSNYDEKSVIENTIDRIGASKILEHLHSENKASTPEIQQFCSSKIPLKDIVKNHKTDDLRQALCDLVETKTLDRNDLIQNCLVPLVETPNDLQPYLNSLSMVDIGDIVIKRLPEDGSDEFLTKLSKICLNGVKEPLTVQLCKKNLLEPKDFVSFFKDCLSDKSDGQQTEIMVEMFKFLSGKISVEKLAGLHMEFLQRISSNFSINHK